MGSNISAQDSKVENSRNSCSDYLHLKKEMDNVVTKILDEYVKDQVFVSKFKSAQVAWQDYRDAQLEMIFPASAKGEYGSTYPICRCNWLVDITNQRLDYLVKWLSQTNEGACCGGSANSTKRRSVAQLND
jgi:uncharacterized protein YecT (DUF1311 family)